MCLNGYRNYIVCNGWLSLSLLWVFSQLGQLHHHQQLDQPTDQHHRPTETKPTSPRLTKNKERKMAKSSPIHSRHGPTSKARHSGNTPQKISKIVPARVTTQHHTITLPLLVPARKDSASFPLLPDARNAGTSEAFTPHDDVQGTSVH